MKLLNTKIKGLKIIKSQIFKDSRGFLKEVYRKNILSNVNFPFDVMSHSKKNVLRGLHIQTKNAQAKIITVTHGKILDVIVDLRKSSLSFGKYFSIELSSDNNKQLWIPPGIAHGFLTLKNNTKFIYQTTEYYEPDDEYTILWNDQSLNIDWKLNGSVPLISDKDISGSPFLEAKYYD